MRRTPQRPTLSLVPLLVGLALVAGSLTTHAPADAAVVRLDGFHGTVAGWRSWYGSYGLGTIGSGWCIDHGLRAPDAVYDYVATNLPGTSADTKAAMAWVLGRHRITDRIGSAAMMLVLHDLMGAIYPTGRLDVDRLTTASMSGFEGYEAAVLERARAYKRDALAHKHLRGPITVDLTVAKVAPGVATTAHVRVRDVNGAGVEGAWARVTSPTSPPKQPAAVRTDADGRATFTFTAVEGTNRFEAEVRTPAVTPTAWTPTTARAQRVAQRHELALRAAGGFTAERPTGELIVHKTGDAEPVLTVAGTSFEVHDAAGRVAGRATVGANGYSGALQLPVGRYRVVESRRPAGYDYAPAQSVDVVAGQRRTVHVHDVATRGRLVLLKLSSSDEAPLAGAVVDIHHDSNGDGTFETHVATLTTGADGTATLENLLPGAYLATEVEAPDGHQLLGEPVPFTVTIDGLASHVVLMNQPRSSVRFRKVPVGEAPPEATLAGATFVVVALDNPSEEVGRCTTGDDGTCSLPAGALVGGAEHCWAEVQVPFGWAPAEPGCFTAGPAASLIDIEVLEQSRFTDVTATKRDAATGAPLAGATYDLYRVDASAIQRTTPEDAMNGPAGTSWVGRATSDADGLLRWQLADPDAYYCVLEREAPAGYALAEQVHCAEHPHTPERPVHFDVVDDAIPVQEEPVADEPDEPAPTTTTPTTAPPTTAPPTTAPPTTLAPTETTAPPGTIPMPSTSLPSTSVTPTTVRRPPPVRPTTLPVTGGRATPLTALGVALVLGGLSLQTPLRRAGN